MGYNPAPNPKYLVEKPKQTLVAEEPKPAPFGADWTPGPMGKKALVLRMSPLAWAKIHHHRDNGNKVEVSGFGISHADNPLVIMDFVLAFQKSTPVFTEMDDTKLADFIEDMIDVGYRPDQISRVWIHTHPGQSAVPSGHDEKTFDKTFDDFDWAIMCVVAQGAQTARLKVKRPFYWMKEVPIEVDWSIPLVPVDYEVLNREFVEKVKPNSYIVEPRTYSYAYPGRAAARPRRTRSGSLLEDDFDDRDHWASRTAGWPELTRPVRDTPPVTKAQSAPAALELTVDETDSANVDVGDLQREKCEFCGIPTLRNHLDRKGYCPSCQMFEKDDPEDQSLLEELAMTQVLMRKQ